MLKNILKLDGAQELSKTEQKSINGGLNSCFEMGCRSGECCVPVSDNFGICHSIAKYPSLCVIE
jgi:hypothetical protein